MRDRIRADRAVGTRMRLDDDVLAPYPLETFGNEPREPVALPARGGPGDDLDRTVGVALGGTPLRVQDRPA